MRAFVSILALLGAIGSSALGDSIKVRATKGYPCPVDFTGNIRNPEDCRTFYICEAGTAWLISCPADLCYSTEGGEGEGGSCQECDNVDGCGAEDSPRTTTARPPRTTSAAPPSPTTTEAPRPSTQAPTAAPTQPEATTTEAPRPSTQAPTAAPTQPEATTPAPTNPPPSPTSTQKTTTRSDNDNGGLQCPSDVAYIYMPFPGNCNKFYYCLNGKNTGVHNCGQDLWFNFQQQVCAPPWGASCEN